VVGIGCVAGEPSALAMRGVRGGRSCFLFKGLFSYFVVVIFWIAVGEGSDDVLREPCNFPCDFEGDSEDWVSSSSGRMRVRCFGVKPLWMC